MLSIDDHVAHSEVHPENRSAFPESGRWVAILSPKGQVSTVQMLWNVRNPHSPLEAIYPVRQC
jgi:hypothetical protein